MTGGWFTLTELQERLNRDNRKALLLAIKKKEIPLVRFGNDYLIEDADWLAWMRSQKQVWKPKPKRGAA